MMAYHNEVNFHIELKMGIKIKFILISRLNLKCCRLYYVHERSYFINWIELKIRIKHKHKYKFVIFVKVINDVNRASDNGIACLPWILEPLVIQKRKIFCKLSLPRSTFKVHIQFLRHHSFEKTSPRIVDLIVNVLCNLHSCHSQFLNPH
jgi:hypothetical protein